MLSVTSPLRALWHVRPWFSLVLSIKPRLIYIHGFTSKIEATEKLKQQPRKGAFDHLKLTSDWAIEQLFGPGRWGFQQKIFKTSNAWGVARGGGC